jgi:hypothetical protein
VLKGVLGQAGQGRPMAMHSSGYGGMVWRGNLAASAGLRQLEHVIARLGRNGP